MTMIAGNDQVSEPDDGGREQDAVREQQQRKVRALARVLARPLPTVLWQISDNILHPESSKLPDVAGQIHRGTSARAGFVAYETLLEWAEAFHVPTQVQAPDVEHPWAKVWIWFVDQEEGITFEVWTHVSKDAWDAIRADGRFVQ